MVGNPILESNSPISPELAAAIQNVSGGSNQAQFITDTKFSTKTLAAAVWPATTDFFTTAPVVDPTLDYYDAGNQLVSSGKIFMIKGLGCCLRGGALADIDAIINTGILVLTIQNKEDGRHRVRNCNSAGGVFIAATQGTATTGIIGATNGMPQNQPWCVCDMLAHTNQQVKVSLWAPVTTPYTIGTAVQFEVDLFGYEIRPLA
jgi:hypothetical protein